MCKKIVSIKSQVVGDIDENWVIDGTKYSKVYPISYQMWTSNRLVEAPGPTKALRTPCHNVQHFRVGDYDLV